MANPTATTRILPGGVRLDNGWPTTIAFASNPSIEIYEKSIQPARISVGDPIMTDTMLNVVAVTKAPPCLEDWGDIVVVAAYDPSVMDELRTLLGQIDSVTINFPEGTQYVFWAYLGSIEFSPLVKNTQPEVTLTITVTNWDPIRCVEALPVINQGTGSCQIC